MKKSETCSYISHRSDSDENAIDCKNARDCVKHANVFVGLRKEIFARTHTATHICSAPYSDHDDTHTHLIIVSGAPRPTAWRGNIKLTTAHLMPPLTASWLSPWLLQSCAMFECSVTWHHNSCVQPSLLRQTCWKKKQKNSHTVRKQSKKKWDFEQNNRDGIFWDQAFMPMLLRQGDLQEIWERTVDTGIEKAMVGTVYMWLTQGITRNTGHPHAWKHGKPQQSGKKEAKAEFYSFIHTIKQAKEERLSYLASSHPWKAISRATWSLYLSPAKLLWTQPNRRRSDGVTNGSGKQVLAATVHNASAQLWKGKTRFRKSGNITANHYDNSKSSRTSAFWESKDKK